MVETRAQPESTVTHRNRAHVLILNPLPRTLRKHKEAIVILFTRAHCHAAHYLSQMGINLLAFYHESLSIL